MKNKFIITENEINRIKSLHKKFGYRSGLLTEAEYLNQERPNDPFQYLKVDDGSTTKYYYKGIKGEPLKKYPNWTEATGNGLEAIKSKVTFNTTAESNSQLSSTQKTDEELYTEYFNNEFKKIKPETLPKGKITKLSDGTYGYVLEDGSYTLLSDGYSINKDGAKSTNKWTETPFVKPEVNSSKESKTDYSKICTTTGGFYDSVTKVCYQEEDDIKNLVNSGNEKAKIFLECIKSGKIYDNQTGICGTGKSVIDLLSEYIKSKYPTIQIPQTVLDTLKTLLSGVETSIITKITEFLTTKTGTIEDLLKLIPDSIKSKVLDILKQIPNLISADTTTQKQSDAPAIF